MPCPLVKHIARPRRNKLKGNRAQGVQRVRCLRGPRADTPVSIPSDRTREKGSGPAPFLNPSAGARAKLKHPAQSLREAAHARGRRAGSGLGQGHSPRCWVAGMGARQRFGSKRLCQPPSSSPSPAGNRRGRRLRGPGGRRSAPPAHHPTAGRSRGAGRAARASQSCPWC